MMNRRLKRAVTFYAISGIVLVAPVVVSIVIAIIGATHWNWEGRGFLTVVAGLAVSITLVFFFIGLMDEHEDDIREWIKEPEAEKPSPKAGAWKEKDA